MTTIDTAAQRTAPNVNTSVGENPNPESTPVSTTYSEQRNNVNIIYFKGMMPGSIHELLQDKNHCGDIFRENSLRENSLGEVSQRGNMDDCSRQSIQHSCCHAPSVNLPQNVGTNGVVDSLKNFANFIAGAAEAVYALLRNPVDADTSAFATPIEKPAEAVPQATTATPVPLTFSEKMKLIFSNSDKKRLSEQDVRRGVVTYQLYQKDPKLADAFQSYFDAASRAGNSKDLSLQKALIHLIEDGKLPRSDASWVYSLSFRAAQLDKNENKLSNKATLGHGKSLQDAIKIAEANLAGIQNGSVSVNPLTL